MAMAGESDTAAPSRAVRRGGLVPEAPRLSICILVLDNAVLAVACLDALRRPGACPPGTEFVVVANGTPSEQREALVAHDDVVLVVNEVNLGFAAGCNQAVSVARAPLLVFLNDDSTVEDGCIDALVAAVAADPAIGAVGARILSGDGSLQEAGSVIWRDGSTTHVGEGLAPGSAAYDEPRDVDYASANGLLVTRRAWDAVGGFDERFYPAYFEDVDLCLALVACGFRVRYEPAARVVHLGSQSTTGVYRVFLLTRNQRLLVEKWDGVLDRFEVPHTKDSGAKLEAAVRRAVSRAAARHPLVDAGAGSGSPSASGASPVAADPLGAADALAVEYHAYLEQRVAAGDSRVTMLETYLRGLWGVRLRRWIGGAVARRRTGGASG
jgi:GT2 family glycosyltransferase